MANLALFAFLSFGPLSHKVVTEHLINELNDARSVMQSEFEANPMHHRAAKKVAPMLRKFERFQAILLLDSRGQVVHREQIHEGGIQIKDEEPEKERKGIIPVPPNTQGEQGSSQWVSSPNNQSRLALEYDPNVIETEVRQVRHELQRKLLWALAVSLTLLLTGGIYVILAYKRNRAYEQKARKADKMAYVGTLAAGLAHEIRNPLNSMNMNLQLIREELLDMGMGQNSEIEDMFDGTSREINRLSKLVSSFLAYARPSQLATSVQPINPVIEELAQFIAPEVKARGVQLEQKLGRGLPDIPIDESQLRQGLLNILQNAIQVLEQDDKLIIETRKIGSESVIISIRDEGPGIAPDRLEDIAKVFYSTKRGGTGLGIPIAQRIAEQHGGGLKIESEVGVGTTVTFILPIETPQEAS